jgi:hypothetical protein
MTNDDLEAVYTRLLIRFQDHLAAFNEMRVRFEIMEKFVKDQYPAYFAGEVGTVVDPDLNPIPIVYGAPQEIGIPQADGSTRWERSNAEKTE